MLRTAMMTGIALSLAATAFAQQQTDPQLKQQAEAVYSKWEKAINDYDPSGLKAVETPDEFTISSFGVEGPSGAEKAAERNKKAGLNVKGSVKEVQQIDPDTAVSYGPYEVTIKNPQTTAQGNWMQVLEKQGSEWKVRAMSYSRMAPQQQPATASSGAAQPTSGSSSK